MTTRSQTNSEFESIAITDALGTVIGLDVAQLAVADVANLTIPGGTAGQLLSTDGNGALSWATAGGASVQVATQATETFTATAAQTVFTLARIPSGSVTCSINGVTSATAAFTIAGTTLTYDSLYNGAYLLKAGDRITASYLYGSTSATQLGGLADVTITTPAAGEVLTFDAGTSAWVNVPGATSFGLVANGTSNVSVAASGNVTVGVAGTNDVATFASTGVTVSNLTVSGTIASLGDIAGVQITGGTVGQAVQSLGGGDLAFVNPTRFVTLAYASANWSWPANWNVGFLCKYDTKLYDPQALYDVNTGRFQPKVAGWYNVNATADTYVGTTAEAVLKITHSVDGDIAFDDGHGKITSACEGTAYFNGTTDYAYVQIVTGTAQSRSQLRSRSNFSAMYLGL